MLRVASRTALRSSREIHFLRSRICSTERGAPEAERSDDSRIISPSASRLSTAYAIICCSGSCLDRTLGHGVRVVLLLGLLFGAQRGADGRCGVERLESLVGDAVSDDAAEL